MSFFGTPTATLVGTGADKRRVRLPRDGSLVIGRSAEAQLRLEGPTIEPVHARLHVLPDGSCALEPCAVNPILVNGATVGDTRVLLNGDVLQFGPSYIFRFSTSHRPKREARPTEGKAAPQAMSAPDAPKPDPWRRLKLVLSLLAPLYGAAFLWLATRPDSTDGIAPTGEWVERVVSGLPACVREIATRDGQAAANLTNGPVAGLTSLWRTEALRTGTADEREAAMAAVGDGLRRLLIEAAVRESRGDMKGAREYYRSALRMVDDFRCPVTKLIMVRLQAIRVNGS